MKKLFFIFLLFPIFSIAQELKGIVVSASNQPVQDVNISYLSKSITALTDDKGQFSLKSEINFRENDTLQFSHISYKTTKITVNELRKANFKVILKQKTEDLSELTIKANHELKLKSKLNFNELAPLKYAIFSFGSFLKDGKIYAIGGNGSREADSWKKLSAEKVEPTLKDLQDELSRNATFLFYKGDFLTYDIKNDAWEVSPTKFTKRAHHNIHLFDNSIYVLGGKRISVNGKFEYLQDQIEVLDLTKQTIKVDNTNPHQAADFASFTYKDNIIVMGGSVKMTESGKKDFTHKVHLYNIKTGYWYELANMSTAKEVNGILIDDKIFLIGGNNGKPLSEIETLDLVTEKWETEGHLFSNMERPAITYHNNIIYFFEDQKMYVYHIKSKVLKEYLVDLPLKLSAMHFYNDKLYIIGGYTYNDYSKTPSDKTYSISIGEFENTKPNRFKTLSQESDLVKTN
ncbi:carboxypeptidase-like regulatory domain-containing protein [Flavobacterium sp. Root186]|uniref:Kelch repeat-containing protein n=1 Tax=Flavobacterium sp. Root186 TaxID=1736485 RepID=UPI0006F421EE|nr:carboxypeptidase-like regulatory domain-containing protein [Flavobacterium sp. Root186]KRB56542.1 galactose oxidase [Flavobacterium sp. Root186]